jgi:hypothetical protein
MNDRQLERKIFATETWSLRRISVSYREHRTNDQVLSEANTSRKLVSKMRQRQCRLIGHKMLGGGRI